MSAEKFKVVARTGIETALEQIVLINGELGYILDRKMGALGDDTEEAPRFATHKSVGLLNYAQGFTPKYGAIEMYTNGKVDGVDISTMNQGPGFPARIADGVFINRAFTGEAGYIKVVNGSGEVDNVIITLDDNAKQLLGGEGVSAVRFSWGNQFPVNVLPGHLHFDDEAELIYIRAKQTDGTEFWYDLSSVIGARGRSKKFYYQMEAPIDAVVGDEWLDTETERLYIRWIEDDRTFWLEQRI